MTCRFIDNFKPVHMLVPGLEDGKVISRQCSGILWQCPTPGPPSTLERSQLCAPRLRHQQSPMQPPLAPDVPNRNTRGRIEHRQCEWGQAIVSAVCSLAGLLAPEERTALANILLSEPTGRRCTGHSGRRSDSEASTFQTRSLRAHHY